jgi:hypothetical protein
MTLPIHPEKKLELIVPEAIVPRMVELIQKNGARGYTILETRGGMGLNAVWDDEEPAPGLASSLILVITNAEKAERLMEACLPYVRKYGGIIYSSDVAVLRPERF